MIICSKHDWMDSSPDAKECPACKILGETSPMTHDKTLEELAERAALSLRMLPVGALNAERYQIVLEALQSATAAQQKEIEELTTILQQITTPQTIEHLREQLRNKRKYATPS